jgi:hypothetical protein
MHFRQIRRLLAYGVNATISKRIPLGMVVVGNPWDWLGFAVFSRNDWILYTGLLESNPNRTTPKNEKAMKYLFADSNLTGAIALLTLAVGCRGPTIRQALSNTMST